MKELLGAHVRNGGRKDLEPAERPELPHDALAKLHCLRHCEGDYEKPGVNHREDCTQHIGKLRWVMQCRDCNTWGTPASPTEITCGNCNNATDTVMWYRRECTEIGSAPEPQQRSEPSAQTVGESWLALKEVMEEHAVVLAKLRAAAGELLKIGSATHVSSEQSGRYEQER